MGRGHLRRPHRGASVLGRREDPRQAHSRRGRGWRRRRAAPRRRGAAADVARDSGVARGGGGGGRHRRRGRRRRDGGLGGFRGSGRRGVRVRRLAGGEGAGGPAAHEAPLLRPIQSTGRRRRLTGLDGDAPLRPAHAGFRVRAGRGSAGAAGGARAGLRAGGGVGTRRGVRADAHGRGQDHHDLPSAGVHAGEPADAGRAGGAPVASGVFSGVPPTRLRRRDATLGGDAQV